MKLKFHRYAHDRAFRSPADFARFADAQKAKFEALRDSSARDFEWWGQAVANNWSRAASAARSDPASIQQILGGNPVFLFESRLTQVLQQMTLLGKKAAAQEIMPFLLGQRDNSGAGQVHVLMLDARAQFHTAIALEASSRREQGQTSFADVLIEHEARLESVLDADQEELGAKRAEFATMIESSEARFQTLGQQIEQSLAEWKGMWEETHNSFVEQLATETAVKLWSDRSTTHETRYKAFRKLTIAFGIGGLLITLLWIFGGFAFARWIFDDTTAQLASYTAGSLALFTLFVWGLRVLIRSMMSEDHLSTDASARSALAHTYLALTKEEAARPEDRAIILATLFAPVSDGLVKDDGMPALSPAAFAAQVLTNPGR